MRTCRSVAPLPLAAALAGCYAMAPVAAPQDYIVARRPSLLVVTRADGSVVEVEGPSLKGDSVMGFVNGRYQFISRVADAQRVTARQHHMGRTALFVGGVTAAVLGTAIMLSGGGSSGEEFLCEDPPDCTP